MHGSSSFQRWMDALLSSIHKGGATNQRTEGGRWMCCFLDGWLLLGTFTAFISLGAANMRDDEPDDAYHLRGWSCMGCPPSANGWNSDTSIHYAGATKQRTYSGRWKWCMLDAWFLLAHFVPSSAQKGATLNRSERRTENHGWYIWMISLSSSVFGKRDRPLAHTLSWLSLLEFNRVENWKYQ